MTFESTRNIFNQYHFTVVEIDLPGVSNSGYGTPVTEGVASDTTNTYRFTTTDAPQLNESGILRIIDMITESPAKLQLESGLAMRGSGTITMFDVKGDPNLGSPAVTTQVINTGTFLAKLDARNILVNKALRIKNYRLDDNGQVNLADSEAEIRHYIIESFDNVGTDKWQLKFKDELYRLNLEEAVFPPNLNLELSLAASDTQTQFFLSPTDAAQIAIGDTVRIGDELMKVNGKTSNSFSISSRGADIVYTQTLSTTVASAHSAGDEVFVCDVMDDENIADFLRRVLLSIGVPDAYIPLLDWQTEIATWHPTSTLNGLWIESLDAEEVISQVLRDYFIDMWFDPVDREVKIAAVSQWQQSVNQTPLTEGNEIDFGTAKRKKAEQLRYTRSLIVYDKPNKTESDDVQNYRRASVYSKTELETSDRFGDPKTKRFPFSPILNKTAADLLTSRYVERFSNPFMYSWITQERKLTFKVGDVVDIQTDADVGFGGNLTINRAQVQNIKPIYTAVGREYRIDALTYNPDASANTERVVTGEFRDFNIWNYFGNPPDAIDVVIIFDGAQIGGRDTLTGLRAGNFAAGSKITIILVNGADIRGKGGAGGDGGGWVIVDGSEFIRTSARSGGAGGIAYDAEGINTDIYFSGDYTAVSTYGTGIADGFVRAPCGGDSGFSAVLIGTNQYTPGAGGDGGIGLDGGDPGLGGTFGAIAAGDGQPGAETNVFGQVGADNSNDAGVVGGAAGSGVVANGATVNAFGANSTRYVQGNGIAL